jgi:hypothetical protein
MHAFRRAVVVLITALAVMAVVVSGASPPRVLWLGATIDRIVSRSIDVWVGRDTLHLVPPPHSVVYDRLMTATTDVRIIDEGAWRGSDTRPIPPDATESVTHEADDQCGLPRPGET